MIPAAPSGAERAAYRKALLQAGFSPTPLNGKRAVLEDWPNLTPTDDDIERWAQEHPWAANTGFLTRLAPVLDIDVLDPDAAEAIESLVKDRFGDCGSVLVRIGRAPKRAIPFRTERPFPKISVSLLAPNGREERIEFLADGQQCVASGIHPDTKAPYRWLGGEPGAVKREELPAIDAREARELVDNAVELLTVQYGYRRKEKTAKPNGAASAGGDVWAFLHNSIDHDELTAGAMTLLRAGMHDAAVVNLLRARVTNLHDVDEDRRDRRFDEIPAMVESARAKLGGAPPAGDGDIECARLEPLPIEAIPPQQWAYGKFLLFGSAAVLGALDGVGKGFVTTAIILSMITGRALLGERVWRSGPVAIVTYEDDELEWRRRIAAACLYHQVDYDLVIANVYFIRRKTGRVVIAERTRDRASFPDGEAIISRLRAIGAVMLVIDPFNSAHAMDDGNNNVAIAAVAGEVTRIAQVANVAALVLHHLRKGASGAVDDLMGATALRANFRACRILQRMTDEQAEALGITADQCFRYIRISSSKENYAPPPDKAAWFKLESQALGNGTKLYPDGDNKAVATVWRPPSPFEGVGLPALKAIFDKLREGAGEGWFYSIEPRAKYPAHDVIMQAGALSKAKAISILKTWVENDVVRRDSYRTPNRDNGFRVVLNEAKVAAILAPLRTLGESDD